MSLSEKDEVLDIGIGAGAWLSDVRALLPDPVRLYGVDVESRLFPRNSPPLSNVHLSVCSGTALPPSWTSKFALVNQRLMIGAYTRAQWQRSIAEMHRVLAPGGYVQLIEFGPEWVSGPRTATFILFIDEFFASKGMLWHCGACLANMLKATGFIDVITEEAQMPFGKWAGENGVQSRDSMVGMFKGFGDSMMKAGGFGRFSSGGEFEKAIAEVAKEWDNVQGSHAVLRVCCGRKSSV